MSVLVAAQDDLPRDGHDLPPAGVARWLYVGGDSGRRIELAHTVLAGLEPIELGPAIQAEAARLRQPYLDWVGGLAQTNDSAEWWASELAARNSYTLLFSNLCSLAAARSLLAGTRERTLVVCSSRALVSELLELPRASPYRSRTDRSRSGGSRALRVWARVAPEPLLRAPGAVSKTARALLDSDPRYRRRILTSLGARPLGRLDGPDSVLLFTWVDGRSTPSAGVYRDPHLGVLPQLLRDRGAEVASVARVLHTTPFAGAAASLVASGEPLVFPDLYLGLDDWRDAAGRANSFQLRLPETTAVADVPVRRLALECVERYRPAQAVALSYEALVRRLAATGVRPGRVIHTYEGHAWELALARAVRRHWPDTRLIGYENLNMSRFSLSMYPAEGEIGIRPLPDRIVTNGPAYARILAEEGVPEAIIRQGCALRHADLRVRQPWKSRTPGAPVRVLVATDGERGRAAELVETALIALGGRSAYDVTVKCHPLVSATEIRSLLGELTETRNVRFVEAPISDLLASADVLLYTYSVVCFEALSQGVPPVFVGSDDVVDLDHLEPFAELRRAARSPQEVREAVDATAAMSTDEHRNWQRQARAAVDDALAPVTSECAEGFLR